MSSLESHSGGGYLPSDLSNLPPPTPLTASLSALGGGGGAIKSERRVPDPLVIEPSSHQTLTQQQHGDVRAPANLPAHSSGVGLDVDRLTTIDTTSLMALRPDIRLQERSSGLGVGGDNPFNDPRIMFPHSTSFPFPAQSSGGLAAHSLGGGGVGAGQSYPLLSPHSLVHGTASTSHSHLPSSPTLGGLYSNPLHNYPTSASQFSTAHQYVHSEGRTFELLGGVAGGSPLEGALGLRPLDLDSSSQIVTTQASQSLQHELDRKVGGKLENLQQQQQQQQRGAGAPPESHDFDVWRPY